MKVIGVFLVIAISSVLSMHVRPKRQSSDTDDSNDLEDRYGWQGRPSRQWNQFPSQFPGQNQFPGQGQNQFPGQGQNQFPGQGQNQFPSQGQNQFPRPGQNQFPGQGQNQFPGQGQNQFPGQGQNQFPGQNQLPGQGQNQNQAQQQSTTASNTGVQDCMRTCPVTSEYNPVCGTDGRTYSNPGRLACGQGCGVNVSQQRSGPCPVSTTAAPTK